MNRLESAFISGTVPMSGSSPFPPSGSSTKSPKHRATIQKLVDYVRRYEGQITSGVRFRALLSARMRLISEGISVFLHARKEVATASSKFSSSTSRFSSKISLLNSFLSFIDGGCPCYINCWTNWHYKLFPLLYGAEEDNDIWNVTMLKRVHLRVVESWGEMREFRPRTV